MSDSCGIAVDNVWNPLVTVELTVLTDLSSNLIHRILNALLLHLQRITHAGPHPFNNLHKKSPSHIAPHHVNSIQNKQRVKSKPRHTDLLYSLPPPLHNLLLKPLNTNLHASQLLRRPSQHVYGAVPFGPVRLLSSGMRDEEVEKCELFDRGVVVEIFCCVCGMGVRE